MREPRLDAPMAALDAAASELAKPLGAMDEDAGWTEDLRLVWLRDVQAAIRGLSMSPIEPRAIWFGSHAARKLDHDGIDNGELADLIIEAQYQLGLALRLGDE